MKIDKSNRVKWYVITGIGAFFFPVGIIGNIVNTIIDYKKCKEKNHGILYSALGATVFSLFMMGYILMTSYMSSISDDGKTFFPLLLMYIPSFVMAIYLYIVYFCHAHRCKYLSRIYSLIELDHITSVSMMSEILGINCAQTRKYLKTLIKMGHLQDSVIDVKNNEIILKKCIWAKQRVLCQTCGAEIMVTFGQTLVCEYCGGALMVKRIRDDPSEPEEYQ